MRGNVTEGCHATLKNVFHHGNSCLEPELKLTEATRKISCCQGTRIHDVHMEDFCLRKADVDSFDCNWADYWQQRINLLFGFSMQYRLGHLMACIPPECRACYFSYISAPLIAKRRVCEWNFILL